MNNTVVGVDLAKDVIQVCLIKGNKEVSNEEMSYSNFNLWLSTHTSQTIVFEACGTSNYWKQRAVTLGHTAHLISAKLVASIRQNQKTDKNDALAIAQAALLPEVNFISGKNIEQQQLQSLMRLRELAVKQKVAMNNQLKALLLEFNIRISTRKGGLCEVIQSTLENADNDFSMPFRQALEQAFQQYLGIISSIKKYDTCIEQSLNQNNDCKRLMRLEGVGTINAVNLYITLGCSDFGVNTHPEFDEFEKYQAMSLEEISLEIKQRLETGLYLDSLKEAKSEGVDMLFRLNPTPLQSHNKALKFSVKNTQN